MLYKAGPIDERERALVKWRSVEVTCFAVLKSHIKKAVALGMTREEIEHVALLLPTMGFPTMNHDQHHWRSVSK